MIAGQGLGWVQKVVLVAIIVGLCVGYLKMRSPGSKVRPAGRHGAYEKSRA